MHRVNSLNESIDNAASTMRDMVLRAAFSPTGTVEFAPRSASSQAVLRAVRSRHLEIAGGGLARVTLHGLRYAALPPDDRDAIAQYLVLHHEQLQLQCALKLRPRDIGIVQRLDEVRRGLACAQWCVDPELGLVRQEELAQSEREVIARQMLH